MKNHSFMFLDSDFQDISNFCMRMEKNIVEGDGVDAVIWAGKIAERVTHYITKFVGIDLNELDQNKKLNTLYSKGIIPEDKYNKLDSIRQYRNIATHHELRDEMNIAKKTHKDVFNILSWFYGTYKGDEAYYKLKYPGVTYRHDESFLNQLKENINNNVKTIDNNKATTAIKSANDHIYQHDVDYNVHSYFNQNNVEFNPELNAYTAFFIFDDKKVTIGHFKTREVAVRKGYRFVLNEDFRMFQYFNGCLLPERLEDGSYSDSKGIDFDMEEKLWKASFDDKDLGYFISENSAIIARKEYIDTLPLPESKNGSYSDYKEISFDLNHKLWYIKKEGKILDYYDSEREAIHNLSNVYRLDIDLEDLGIVQDKNDSRWKIFYKNKYVTTCDTKEEAIKKRLSHISSFAPPKRNKDGEYSIHKGIYYDDKNLIWVLTIKGETLGFFDSEEDAFNYKKEFLKSKGFDVSDLIFHQEELFDDSFDFKVRLNSEENAVDYDKNNDEWVIYFRGNEIGRKASEDEARKFRRAYLKEMPYPPRKSNGNYSFIDGIDYDINSHLWLAKNGDEIIGQFDSEEDAFYGLKEALVKEGIDVSDLHFINSDIKSDDENDSSLSNIVNPSKDYLIKDNSTKDYLSDDSTEDSSSQVSNQKDGSDKLISFYDVFRTNTGNYILSDSEESLSDSVESLSDSVESLSDSVESINKPVESDGEIFKNKSESIANDSAFETDNGMGVIDQEFLANGDNEFRGAIIQEDNSKNINEYKKSSFYGIANHNQDNRLSDDLSIPYLESEDNYEYMEDLNLEQLNLDENNGFLNISENLFKSSNRKDLKEIKLNSYDSNNFRREMVLSYNDSYLCVSLQGMVNKDELKDIIFLDILDNMVKLNYSKVDEEYFSIFINVQYKLSTIDLVTLINLLSDLGWEFDLLDKLAISNDINLNSLVQSKIGKIRDKRKAHSNELIKSSHNEDSLSSKSKINDSLVSNESDSNKGSSKFKENLSLYDKFSLSSNDAEDSDAHKAKDKSLKSKDYLDANPISKRKSYPKQESISSKNKKSNSKSEKAIIRGGVRVSLEEAHEIDNAEENKVIKSKIIDKKPEMVKDFKTTSLDSLLEANRIKEEERLNSTSDDIGDDLSIEDNSDTFKDDLNPNGLETLENGLNLIKEGLNSAENDLDSVEDVLNSEEDDLDSVEDVLNSEEDDLDSVEDVLNSEEDDLDSVEDVLNPEEDNYVSESSLNDDFDSLNYPDSLEDSTDSSFDYGDVLDEDDSNSNSIEDIFNDEDDLDSDGLFDEGSDDVDFLEKVSSDLSSTNLFDESADLSANDLFDGYKDSSSSDLFDNGSETSFEDELDNIGSSNQEDLSTESNDSDSNLEEIGSLKETADQTESESDFTASKVSKPKVKKAKKPKKVPADAFDEKYANSTEIEYDEENDKWFAFLGGDLIRSFNTPKEAYIERKKLLRRKVKRPKRGMNGRYSEFEGIDFNTQEGLWTSSVNDIIVSYSITEKEAHKKRTMFVDLILDKFDVSEEEFTEDLLEEIKSTNLEDLFADLSDEDLNDSSNLSLKEVKKELNKF